MTQREANLDRTADRAGHQGLGARSDARHHVLPGRINMPNPTRRTIRSLGMTAAAAAVPVGTALLLAWHPADPSDPMELEGLVARWIAIHVGLLVALPLVALVIIRLLRGIDSAVAKMSRRLLVPAAALYAAFDSLVGIGTGVLVDEVGHLDDHLIGGAIALVEAWWAVPPVVAVIALLAITTWAISVATAGVAALDAGLGPLVGWPLIVSAVVFAFGHPGPTGVIAMVSLAAAVIAAERGRSDGA